MLKQIILSFLFLCLTAGCAVGPDFKKPTAPEIKAYTLEPITLGDNNNQHFIEGDLPGQWWELFHCQALNKLVQEALKNNPDIKAAQASLRAAKENVYAQQGAYYPSVSANLTPSRNKSPEVLSPVPNSNARIYSLDTAQVSVSYSPDVFGLNQRNVESLKAQAKVEKFQYEATYLTLTSNVVNAAIQEASLRAQIKASEKIIQTENELLDSFKKEAQLGQIAESDVITQEAAVAQAELAVPTLKKQLAIQRDQLTALLGRLPSDEPTETFELTVLHLPEELPLSLPSKLVEQRPDIRAAEENLHAASAEIGVAVANRLPNITLDANGGSEALAFSSLFGAGTAFWELTAGITQPIFDSGTLLHKERGARAEFDEAAAQYKSTVIGAFQNVADTLHAIEEDNNALNASIRAEKAAEQSLEVSNKALNLGAVNYLSVLNAQQVSQQSAVSLAQAEANRYADTAALFQALGGGWWNRDDVKLKNSALENQQKGSE